jgi:hypothetical protein
VGKISKADLKVQREIQALLKEERNLTEDEKEYIYEHYNPSMDDSITERGVFFTPLGLAGDVAIFAPKQGYVVDVCAGIGMLSYKLMNYDYYHCGIKEVYLLEYNPRFVEIGKKLLKGIKNEDGYEIKVHYIQCDVFDKAVWENLLKKIPNGKFNLMISNPPYGKMSTDEQKEITWMDYTGERELMALELCLRYAEDGYFIMPPMSTTFQFSGRPYYQELPSKKVERFQSKCNIPFRMSCDGIDCSIYKDEWKNTVITVEAVRIITNPKEF